MFVSWFMQQSIKGAVLALPEREGSIRFTHNNRNTNYLQKQMWIEGAVLLIAGRGTIHEESREGKQPNEFYPKDVYYICS